MNDGINIEDYRCKYTTVVDVATMLLQENEVMFMGKVDLKRAYRYMPIRQEQLPLLCMEWDGRVLIDTRLTFGLRSACAMFERLATSMEVIAREVLGIRLVRHYLDDFIMLCPDKALCTQQIKALIALFEACGMSVSKNKCTEDPEERIVFLGLELDALKRCIRIPQVRMDNILRKVEEWKSKAECTAGELASLIGVLNYAATAVWGAKLFIRRLIDLLYNLTGKRYSRHFIEQKIRSGEWDETSRDLHYSSMKQRGQSCINTSRVLSLTDAAREDLEWWIGNVPQMNGIDFPYFTKYMPREQIMSYYTDSSKHAAGGVFGIYWFIIRHQADIGKRFDEKYLELYGIVCGLAV